MSATRSFLPATDLNKVKLQAGQKAVELGFGAVEMTVVLERECRLEILVPDDFCVESCAFLCQESADDLRRAVVEKFRNFFVAHDVPCDGLVKDEIASRGGVWCECGVTIFVVRSDNVTPFADKAVAGIEQCFAALGALVIGRRFGACVVGEFKADVAVIA